MLKKLFTAALFILATSTANAGFIDGEINVAGFATATVSASGAIESLSLTTATVGSVTDDYSSVLAAITPFVSTFDLVNPLDLTNSIVGLDLFTIEGFTFNGVSVDINHTIGATTSITIIGNVSHTGFDTTESQLFFSSQGLTAGTTTTGSAYSLQITSPTPTVSEPGTLAIFGLGLMGFAVSRKKKSA
jgi:hypothetical protein